MCMETSNWIFDFQFVYWKSYEKYLITKVLIVWGMLKIMSLRLIGCRCIHQDSINFSSVTLKLETNKDLK